MQVAVYDTYVKKADNSGTYHFDIIIEKEQFDNSEVIDFGKEHLNSVKADFQNFSVDECQFCHIETPTEEMIKAINNNGYYILLFDDIPAVLPKNPTRSQMIQHLRAVNKFLRFADFSTYSIKDLLEALNNENKQ